MAFLIHVGGVLPILWASMGHVRPAGLCCLAPFPWVEAADDDMDMR